MARRSVKISAERVLGDLHKLRSFGAVNFDPTSKGGDGKSKGVTRPALTAEDLAARGWFMERCREAGLRPRMDAIGTVLASGEGETPSTKPRKLLCGSHSDSQATGGWLDGALGCVYALETARAFQEAGLPALIDVVNFSDEEGRFGTLTGSAAATEGAVDWSASSLSPEWAAPKETLREAVERAAPTLTALGAESELLRIESGAYAGFFEAHIEQGRRLERAGVSVAAVASIAGLRQLRLEAFGEQNHAGSTLMPDRKDAARALTRVLTTVDEALASLATAVAKDFVWTFSVLSASPGAPSIIPDRAACVLQFRDPDDDVLHAAAQTVRHIADNSQLALVVVADDRPPLAPTVLDPRLRDCVTDAIRAFLDTQQKKEQQDTPTQARNTLSEPLVVPSGAIHDAASLANKARIPAAMLFVPSIGGVSHVFHEDTHERDIAIGAQVYADAAARMLDLSPSSE